MSDDLDDQFYERADEIIMLANSQIQRVRPGKVSASLLYAAARFNVYVSALECDSSQEMASKRASTIEFFLREYREMLEDNLDDYIAHFSKKFPQTH